MNNQRWYYVPHYETENGSSRLYGFDILRVAGTAPNAKDTMVSGDSGFMGYQEDDVRLATSAPELLEQLQAAMRQMSLAYDAIQAGRTDEAMLHLGSLNRQRREVIAKALGLSNASQVDVGGHPVENAVYAAPCPEVDPEGA